MVPRPRRRADRGARGRPRGRPLHAAEDDPAGRGRRVLGTRALRTLVVSDLHLGSRGGGDVLREAEPRAALLRAVEEADRLVILGDLLELRHGPAREALAVADPLLRSVAERLPAGARVSVVAGNHDHALVAPWLERRAIDGADPLRLDESTDATASPLAERLQAALGRVPLELHYPGVWLREDVYATHGHYLDRHVTVPTFERIALGAIGPRVAGPVPDRAEPEDYEAAVAPLYAWLHTVARHDRRGLGTGRQDASVRAWRALTGDGRRGLRTRALVAGFPVAVAALNRLGVGPLRSELSAGELRRSGLRAMGEVVRRLGIEATHVLFGHTHRAGPLPGDREDEWRAGGARLHNAGCWVHDEAFIGPPGRRGPYWPGGALVLEHGDAPRHVALLRERGPG